ncbi:hypothetical protein NQ314_008004 [Rhamnusium bicolor]|uniref:Uncharacterized protein n=1 Tax=Rhamnusium bicolor TaxID=1586634 RepID=A0AAV8YI11_9CUCU|nr:hypothetical protein NQ314_008004 [Rhamnusium bicolor]
MMMANVRNLSDSSDNVPTSCEDEIGTSEVAPLWKLDRIKRKKKPSIPAEIKENAHLLKYWKKDFLCLLNLMKVSS